MPKTKTIGFIEEGIAEYFRRHTPNQGNKHYKEDYAPYEEQYQFVKPLLDKYGIKRATETLLITLNNSRFRNRDIQPGLQACILAAERDLSGP